MKAPHGSRIHTQTVRKRGYVSWHMFLAIWLAVGMASVASAAEEPAWLRREQDRVAVLERIAPAVVCVMPPNGQGGGSGVLISADGFAITNFHVTSGSGNFLKCGLNDGQVYDAVIVGIDPTGDVAMIQLIGRTDFPFADVGDSDEVRVGDEVMALGNPFLLADDFSPTVTYGIVSGIHRYQYPANSFLEYTDCIQIDASINPGNSGGPLFDIHGRWIGINGRASFEQRGRVNVGAAYAISVRQVQLFQGHLKSGRIVDHGTTEFSVETDSGGRVQIADVIESSEAWRRGLRAGDELVSFARRALSSANDFKNVLGIFPSGTRVPLTFRGPDGQRTISIRLKPLHEFQKVPPSPEQRQEPIPVERVDPEDKPQDETPAELASMFEARDGFTNYAFNRQNQQRVQEPLFSKLDSIDGLTKTWKLLVTAEGTTESMTMVVGREGTGLTQRGIPFHQTADELDAAAEPPDFPGLLTAALQWHRLFRGKAADWAETVYEGTERQFETGRSVDVLITNVGPVECRWMFAADSPFPSGVDVRALAGQDEARLLFEDWSTDGEIPHPTRLGVVIPDSGDVRWLQIQSAEIR